MSLDPKAVDLVRRLGALARCYLPGETDAHAMLELFEAFRDGFASAERTNHAFLKLPMRRRTQPGLSANGQWQQSEPTFDLDAPEQLILGLRSNQLTIGPNKPTRLEDAMKNRQQPRLVVSIAPEGEAMQLRGRDSNHWSDEFIKELKFV